MTKSNIASAINAAHAGVEAAKREGARYAVECGRLLIQAKETVPHGGWDGWLRLNTTVSPRTAQLYMRIARHVESDPAKAQRVAGLSVREAAAEAAVPRRCQAAGKPLSQEVEHDFTELMKLWDEAKDKPHWKEGFARELYRRNEISRDQRDKMIRQVWTQHRASLTAEDREAAAQNFVEMLAAHIPRGKLRDLLPKLKRCDPEDIAIALADIQEASRSQPMLPGAQR